MIEFDMDYGYGFYIHFSCHYVFILLPYCPNFLEAVARFQSTASLPDPVFFPPARSYDGVKA